MQVTSLRIYAVKSMAGVDVETAEIEPWGIAGDRRWGMVDDAGTKITAREMYGLLGMRAEPVGSSGVRILDRAGTATLVDAPHYAAPISVSHYRQGQARPASEETNRWLTQRVGRPVRLVWQGDPTARSIAEQHGGKPGDTLSLADAGPLLLVSEASMAQLNAWIAADANLDDVPDLDRSDISADTLPNLPLSIIRFRPNVVIDGGMAFEEEAWTRIRIGDLEFRKTMICDRCVMTTIDPVTLEGGKEPIRTLARRRRREGKTWFGIRLAPLTTGTIRVGEAVVAS